MFMVDYKGMPLRRSAHESIDDNFSTHLRKAGIPTSRLEMDLDR